MWSAEKRILFFNRFNNHDLIMMTICRVEHYFMTCHNQIKRLPSIAWQDREGFQLGDKKCKGEWEHDYLPLNTHQDFTTWKNVLQNWPFLLIYVIYGSRSLNRSGVDRTKYGTLFKLHSKVKHFTLTNGPFVRGIHWFIVVSPHKGPVMWGFVISHAVCQTKCRTTSHCYVNRNTLKHYKSQNR